MLNMILTKLKEKSSRYKDEHLEIRRVPSSSQFILKLISPKSVISIQSSEISDDRIKCIKIRKKQKTNQYSSNDFFNITVPSVFSLPQMLKKFKTIKPI